MVLRKRSIHLIEKE